MSRFNRKMLAVASGIAFGAASSLALAQGVAPPNADAAQARLDWAKRHVELVCDHYQRQEETALAKKCYAEVIAAVADWSRPVPPNPGDALRTVVPPQRPAAVPARRVTSPARPVTRTVAVQPGRALALRSIQNASRAPSSCSSILCSRFVLLGVGY